MSVISHHIGQQSIQRTAPIKITANEICVQLFEFQTLRPVQTIVRPANEI